MYKRQERAEIEKEERDDQLVYLSDEEAEKRARENKNKLSREENEMLNKFIHLMFS